MENAFKRRFDEISLIPPKSKKVQQWQDEAATTAKTLDGVKKLILRKNGDQVIRDRTSSIFKCYKDNYDKARLAYLECVELDKMFVDYFFKLYNKFVG